MVVNCSVYLAEQLYRVRQKIGCPGVGQEVVRLPLDENVIRLIIAAAHSTADQKLLYLFANTHLSLLDSELAR
jgi:hypothetical protein